jgi:hypothetical protein
MSFNSLIGPVREMRAISAAGGGTALTTAATILQFPAGTNAIQVTGRNFASSAVAVQVAFCPWVTFLKTTDALASAANLTDYSDNAQDNSVGTDVTLSSLASTGAVWVGSDIPFRGLQIDVDAPNGTASVLSGTYWNGSTMANISLADATSPGTTATTLGQDGAVTWTVPTDWVPATLAVIGSAVSGIRRRDDALYWVKLVVSVALDSSTTLNSVMALARSTAYFELTEITPEFAAQVHRGDGGVSGLELKVDAGTANAVVNVLTARRFM